MVSKLNLEIKEMYDRTKKAGAKVEDAASSLTKDLKSNVISIQKGKTPFFSKITKRFSEFLKNHKIDIKYLLLVIPIIAIFLIVREAQHLQDIRSKADVHNASVAFQLQNWTLPPAGNFDVWINADSPVAFVNIKISFDPSLVNMTNEITTTGLNTVIQKTSMAEANSTGNVSIVLGLDPSQLNNPPTGTFQVASMTFNANTANPDITTAISFNAGQMQLVAIDQSVFALTTTNLNLVLNPTATPTPSATPVPTPTQTPMPSPTPTATPTPTPGDFTPPAVSITSPANGYHIPSKGSFAVRSTASDASGISRIVISLDGVAQKTCSNTTSCQVNISAKSISAGSHTIAATATDKSANHNTATSTISVTK
jgi:Bacterial Ig domain